MRISGIDFDRLRNFAKEHDFESLPQAARALIFGAMDEYPKWAVLRAERQQVVDQMRKRAWGEIWALLERLRAEVGDVAQSEADEEARAEKERVTFSREDQE